MSINPETFVVIPAHARTILDLSGNELIAYSLIYGYSQDGDGWFVGSLQHVADWCGLSSKIRAKEVLQRLLDKGIIRKRETEFSKNLKRCDYQAVLPLSKRDTAYLKKIRGVSERDTGVSEKDTHNIDNSIVDSIIIEEDNSSRIINNTSNNISSIPKKEKKGLDLSFISIEYLPIIERWLKYKSEKHQGYTQTGIESLYRRLLKLSNGDACTADQIVEYSIAQLYSGIFVPNELKQISQHGSNNQTSGNMFSAAADELRRQRTTF